MDVGLMCFTAAKVGGSIANLGKAGRIGEEFATFGKAGSIAGKTSRFCDPCATDILQYKKLINQLAKEEAASAFTAQGTLSKAALTTSKELIPAFELKNSHVPTGFSKYTTEVYRCPSGRISSSLL